MRSDGVPDFPDPAGGGAIPKTGAQALGVSSSRFQAARSACQHLLPDAASSEQQARQCLKAGDCPQALVQQMLTADRGSPGACAPTGCPTGPTPPSVPRDGPSSTSFRSASPTARRIRRRSPSSSAECGRLDPGPGGAGVELKGTAATAIIVHRRPGPARGGLRRSHVRASRLSSPGSRSALRRSPSPAACARTACRTFPIRPAGPGCPRSPRSKPGSAIPGSSWPSGPARRCSSQAQAQVPRIMTGLLNFARCMRSRGVPNWPDPSTDRNGQPVFDIPGINPDSPRVSNTAGECTHLLVQSADGPDHDSAVPRHRRSRRVRRLRGALMAARGAAAGEWRRAGRAAVAAGWRWASWPLVAAGAAGVGVAGRGVLPGRLVRGRAAGSPPPATAAVTRQDIAATTPVTATLGYAGSYPVRGQGGGTLTWLPSAGQVIRPGHPLYRTGDGIPGRPAVRQRSRTGGPWARG